MNVLGPGVLPLMWRLLKRYVELLQYRVVRDKSLVRITEQKWTCFRLEFHPWWMQK